MVEWQLKVIFISLLFAGIMGIYDVVVDEEKYRGKSKAEASNGEQYTA